MFIIYKESGDLGFFCGVIADTSKINAIRKSIKELEFTILDEIKKFKFFINYLQNLKKTD